MEEDVEFFCIKYGLAACKLFQLASASFDYLDDVRTYELYGIVPLYVEHYMHEHRFDAPL